MKPSWGKIRIEGIASLGVIAFALSVFIVFSVAPRAYSAEPAPTLFVTDGCTRAVTAYSAASNGDVSPLAPATGLADPNSVAIDASGKIYVTNSCFSLATINIYAKGSNGDTAPITTIGGSNTGLKYPVGIAIDSKGKIYVADYGNGIISGPGSIAPSVFVYAAGSKGNVAPIATISGSDTGLETPIGIALDSSGKIYVADYSAKSVFVYSALGTSTGPVNEAPIATLSGSNTKLVFPFGIAVDSSGKIYVANRDAKSWLVYAAGSNGNVAPNATISGSSTKLDLPYGIAVDSSGKIYVADYGADSIFVYAAGSTGNIAPVATISGPNTELFEPLFLALTTPPTTLSAAPSTINFGKVDATGTSNPKKVTLTNKGTAAAQISMVTATEPFKIAGGVNTCSGQTIASKGTCSFDCRVRAVNGPGRERVDRRGLQRQQSRDEPQRHWNCCDAEGAVQGDVPAGGGRCHW